MMGMNMLVESAMNALCAAFKIDPTQAQALFQRIQAEAPEILEFVRAKVGEIDARLAGIERAQKDIHQRLLSIGIPSYGPLEAKGGPVEEELRKYSNGRG